MYTQNYNLFKPNKSHSHQPIQIYQLPTLHPINPPPFTNEASQPLTLIFQQIKSLQHKSSPNQIHTLPSNKPVIQPKMSNSSLNSQLTALKQQNDTLRQQLQEIKKLYEEQKIKYNDLKNLYKEGEAMFQLLEEKRISLEKQNKELRQVLENFYKQLHLENYNFQGDEKKRQQKINNQSKIQKVKIGNKKIPVIKVNVPAETFIKKQHSNSVFSQNSQQSMIEINKQENTLLKQEVQYLKDMNRQLQRKLNEVNLQLQTSRKLFDSLDKKQQKGNSLVSSFKVQTFEQKKQSTNKGLSPSLDFKFNKIQNPPFISQPSFYQQTSTFQQSETLSYYKSKYNILETEVKKKDEALKSLYNQCYSLQTQINKLKSQFSSTQHSSPPQTRQAWTEQKSLITFQLPKQVKFPDKQTMETQSKGQWYYQRKINELQTRVNELNQMCISNVNQTFRINELNDTVSKLTRQNTQNQQKIINQQAQLNRLYKILENKNTELSQIYTTLTESKRNYPIDESKRKSINNIFINTPEKQQFSSSHLSYYKGFSQNKSSN